MVWTVVRGCQVAIFVLFDAKSRNFAFCRVICRAVSHVRHSLDVFGLACWQKNRWLATKFSEFFGLLF